MILKDSFFAPGRYGGGALDVYEGTYKIIGAWEGRDGVVRADWVFPQVKGRDGQNHPRETAVPLSIDLGSDKKHAIAILRTWIKILDQSDMTEARAPNKGSIGEHYTDKQNDYGKDIPF